MELWYIQLYMFHKNQRKCTKYIDPMGICVGQNTTPIHPPPKPFPKLPKSTSSLSVKFFEDSVVSLASKREIGTVP